MSKIVVFLVWKSNLLLTDTSIVHRFMYTTFTLTNRCYVGQRRLHKAIAQYSGEGSNGRGNVAVQVEWKPFMIDPATNKSGETVEDYCRRR